MEFEEPYQLPPEFRQQPLTARMLEDYALCARKFLLSFFVGRDEDQRFRGGPAALHQAVRQALIDCYNLGGPAACGLQTLLDSFEAHWRGELCTDSMEEEQLHEQGPQMLRDYHADHCAETVEVVATDERLTGVIGDQTFVAVADVVVVVQPLPDSDLLPGEVSGRGFQPRPVGAESPSHSPLNVLRFMTSRRPASEAELTEDLSAQLLWLLAHEHYSETRVPASLGDASERESPTDAPPELHVLFYSLRQRRAREVILDAEREAYLRRDLAARAARLYREREFTPVKGKYCRWCRVRNRCPLWQR